MQPISFEDMYVVPPMLSFKARHFILSVAPCQYELLLKDESLDCYL